MSGITSYDGTAHIWDAATGKELKRLGNRAYSTAQFNSEETRVAARSLTGASILDVERSRLARILSFCPSQPILEF